MSLAVLSGLPLLLCTLLCLLRTLARYGTDLLLQQGLGELGLEAKPLIPERMPVLVDGDLLFEDGTETRPAQVANRWLRELPSSGCPAPSSWESYARCLRSWMEFIAEHGVGLFDTRARLKDALSMYAVHRACGPLKDRFEASTWDRHVSVLGSFYRWAVVEGFAQAEPFTYKQATTMYGELGPRRHPASRPQTRPPRRDPPRVPTAALPAQMRFRQAQPYRHCSTLRALREPSRTELAPGRECPANGGLPSAAARRYPFTLRRRT